MKEKTNRLVVANASWAETAPKWLLDAINAERLVQGFASLLDKGKEQVGDAEICLYLYTLNLTQPVSREYTQIYLYVSTKLMKKRGIEVPKDIEVTELNSDEERELNDLRYDLYRKRGGEIRSPLFDVLKEFKKSCKRRGVNKNGTNTKTARTNTGGQKADTIGRGCCIQEHSKGILCD